MDRVFLEFEILNCTLDYMQLFLSVVTIFWFLYIAERLLFWLYVWQLKEYRFDRMRAHFELPTGRTLLFNKLLLIQIVFLISTPLFFIEAFEIWKVIFLPLGALLYFILGAYTLWKISTKNIKTPIFTKKAIFLFLISITVVFSPFVILFLGLLDYYRYTALLVLLSTAVPLIITGSIGITKPLGIYVKKLLIAKATQRRSEKDDLLVIGITGSYGKTTTKEFLAHILSQKFNVLKTEAHNNTELAIARTILSRLNDSHEIFIVEMGAYRRGEIKMLCDMTKPKIGILTGINDQHISLFKTQENIIKGKYELIEALPPKGLAIFNGDNKYCAILYYKTQKPKRMYSAHKNDAEYTILDIKASENVLRWKIKGFGETMFEFEAPLIGRHYAQNLTGAIIVAFELGMSHEEIQNALSTLKPFAHTMELKKGINGIRIIDDSYSGNADGVFAALDALENFSGQKVIVMPTLIELGKNALDIHKKIAERIAEVCKTAIITGSDFFEPMREVAMANGMTEIDFVYMTDPNKIADKIKSTSKFGDVVLLENRVLTKILDLLELR